MKLLILGATGGTGRQLTLRALEQQYEVTALVRDPSKLAGSDNLVIIKGDARDKETIIKAVEGKDAVLSCIGRGKSLHSQDLITAVMGNLLSAMEAQHLNRLIFLSAFGVGETYKQANLLQKIIFSTFLKNLYADKNKAELLLHNSKLAWTLLYPVVLTNGPRTNNYRSAEKLPMKGMPKISRADVAEQMLCQLTDQRYIRKGIILSN
ncbi:MAG TPA: NAD(P)H-binding protein [Ferruginibacter sp.]|nr:NAD(P)H-binding protein [Ferruginibacter sp.]